MSKDVRPYNYIPDEEIKKDVLNFIKTYNSVSLRLYKQKGKYSESAIQNHFKNWTTLLKLLKVEPKIHYGATKEELVEDVLKVFNKTGKTGRENYLKNGKFSRAIIRRIFGTWNNLLTELGYKINMYKPGQYTKEDILEDYKNLCNKHGKLLTAQEFRKLGKFSQQIIDSSFGSFSKMRQALGLDYFIKKYSDEDIKEILLEVYNKFGFISCDLINEHSKLNTTTICNKYKTLEEACKKFNIPYEPSSMSSYQREITKIVSDLLGEDYESEKRFEWLRNPESGRPLRIDIYYDRLKLAIEADGSQHNKYCSKFFDSEEDFIYRQKLDRIKDKILNDHGITVIRISPKDRKHIQDLLKDFINITKN